MTRPRLRTNSANSSSLNGSGSGCARLKKPMSLFGQAGGDGLVGRQHELLDDLVALVVDGEMRAGDLPCSPSSISISGRESSSAPRLNRRRRRIIASSSICAQHARRSRERRRHEQSEAAS